MRRGDPRMQLRADIASPRGLRRAEDADRAIVGDDRPVDQIDGAHPRAVEPGLAIGQPGPGVEPLAGSPERPRPVEILLCFFPSPQSPPLPPPPSSHFPRPPSPPPSSP